jgi:hypothetical protein
MTSILDLVNNGLKSEGLPALASGLYAGTEDAALILQQKANEANKELCRELEWPQLIKEGTITLATGDNTYAFPSDFDGWVFDTVYNTSDNWALMAPMSPQQYQMRQYSYVSYLNRQRFIVLGYTQADITISPTPDASDNGKTIKFLYMSNNRVIASTGPTVYATLFSADTHAPVLDDDALRFRIMAHYFRSKGLAYETLAAQALERSNERIAAIRGAGPIFCGSRYRRQRFLSSSNVPDSGFGV